MSNSRKSLKKPRAFAFKKQHGRCYYCNLPMWLENSSEFAIENNLSNNQARLFKCTGEHLKPHSSGGNARISNIVAACYFCNQHRHRRKAELAPEQYKEIVQSRLASGRWNLQFFAQNRVQ